VAFGLDLVDSKSQTTMVMPLGCVKLGDRPSIPQLPASSPHPEGPFAGTNCIRPQRSPSENLRLAFQHFFGLDVLRNLELSREFLVKASEGKISDPIVRLARAFLSQSTNPLDEKCPLRFYVPGNDFQPPFVELETTVYRLQGRAYRCSIVG